MCCLSAGGCIDRHASIPLLPVWGLAGPLWDCSPLLLRRDNLPLCATQRVLPVEGDDSQRFPDPELCVGRRHLHLCGDGHSGPPQVAGTVIQQFNPEGKRLIFLSTSKPALQREGTEPVPCTDAHSYSNMTRACAPDCRRVLAGPHNVGLPEKHLIRIRKEKAMRLGVIQKRFVRIAGNCLLCICLRRLQET